MCSRHQVDLVEHQHVRTGQLPADGAADDGVALPPANRLGVEQHHHAVQVEAGRQRVVGDGRRIGDPAGLDDDTIGRDLPVAHRP